MNIYIGNLAWEATDNELKEAFEKFGEVARATVIKDKFSGRSRGFGFVEMPDAVKATVAIEAMDGKDFMERKIKVNEAKPRSKMDDKKRY